MKKIHISTDRILLITIALLLWYSTLVQACESDAEIDLTPEISMSEENSSVKKNYSFSIKRERSHAN